MRRNVFVLGSVFILAVAVTFVVVFSGLPRPPDVSQDLVNGKTVENAVYLAASKVPFKRESFILIEREVVSIIRAESTQASWVYRALVRVNMKNCWNKKSVTGMQILVLTCEKGVDVTDYRSWIVAGQRCWDVSEKKVDAGSNDAPKQFLL